jgi:hypothetical protein
MKTFRAAKQVLDPVRNINAIYSFVCTIICSNYLFISTPLYLPLVYLSPQVIQTGSANIWDFSLSVGTNPTWNLSLPSLTRQITNSPSKEINESCLHVYLSYIRLCLLLVAHILTGPISWFIFLSFMCLISWENHCVSSWKDTEYTALI